MVVSYELLLLFARKLWFLPFCYSATSNKYNFVARNYATSPAQAKPPQAPPLKKPTTPPIKTPPQPKTKESPKEKKEEGEQQNAPPTIKEKKGDGAQQAKKKEPSATSPKDKKDGDAKKSAAKSPTDTSNKKAKAGETSNEQKDKAPNKGKLLSPLLINTL